MATKKQQEEAKKKADAAKRRKAATKGRMGKKASKLKTDVATRKSAKARPNRTLIKSQKRQTR
tara:strand:+ start:293 stop:481 length:189 start_codon:yes stop_codon:yes gene_type:complete